jgi:hypothetical protein
VEGGVESPRESKDKEAAAKILEDAGAMPRRASR